MRYCFSCKRLTAGAPLFCGQCGSTYDVRLCPRLHVNPRGARVCSQCGSHDLSTPQPRRSVFTMLWLSLLLRVPGALLLLLTVALFFAMLAELLTNQQVQGPFFGALLLLGIAWWAYLQLPTPIRHGISRVMRKRRRNGHQ
jgi:RNA polymerase subunit RPABC4/transcription elongation factor Spt4